VIDYKKLNIDKFLKEGDPFKKRDPDQAVVLEGLQKAIFTVWENSARTKYIILNGKTYRVEEGEYV
jgi:hypothetical protein